MHERLGVAPIKLSPYHHVRGGLPPAIIFHGKADTTVDYQTAEMFADAMRKAGNACHLHGYEGERHGFFNFGRKGGKMYRATLRRLDEFMVDLGYLDGRPTIGE